MLFALIVLLFFGVVTVTAHSKEKEFNFNRVSLV
jgi:hypothetical protein